MLLEHSKRVVSSAKTRGRTSDSRRLQLAANAVGTPPSSERGITRDGDPMHAPTPAWIIVERAVLGAAVVPDRQRTNLPAESAGELRLNGMRHQKIENRPCLGLFEPIECLRVIAD